MSFKKLGLHCINVLQMRVSMRLIAYKGYENWETKGNENWFEKLGSLRN